MTQQTGVRSGLLLLVLGLWVLMRTVNQDQTGRTLIDHILGKTAGSGSSAGSAATSSALPAAAPAAPAPRNTGLASTPSNLIGNVGGGTYGTRATAAVKPRITLPQLAPGTAPAPAHGGTF